MVANDLDQAKQHALLSKHGFSNAVGKEHWKEQLNKGEFNYEVQLWTTR
jgi:hypothetical protein